MIETLKESQVNSMFPKRDENSNKGDFGYVTLIGGCVKYSGAIRLAALANTAMRSGAGVCTVAAPKSLSDVILSKILESTFYPLSDNEGELIFKQDEFDELIKRSDVIAFGMGIGNSNETRSALRHLLKYYKGILIVDADGLNAMARLEKKEIKERKCKLILTPHPKEFCRLSQMKLDAVVQDPESSATKLAKDLKAIVLLKGHVSIVTDGTNGYRIEKGGAGMATAGSGDVLSGILAAIVASNTDHLLLATASGAYVNGLAGEMAQAENGDVSMVSGDTARNVQKAIISIRLANPSSDDDKQSSGQAPEPEKPGARVILGRILMFLLIVAAGTYTVYYAMQEKQTQAIEALAASGVDNREQQEEYDLTLQYLEKDIYIDGILVNNYYLYRPFGMYENSSYVPLTNEVCSALGISCSWDSRRTADVFSVTDIYITKAEANHSGVFYDTNGWNPYDIKAYAEGNVTIHISDGSTEELLYPEEYQTVSFNEAEVMYIPISMLANSQLLDISLFFDLETGLYISTDPDIPAENYYSENNASFIAGRVAYIQQYQPNLNIDSLRSYEYIFRHEANVMGVDEDLLLAVARTESSFNIKDVSAAGARGIMQIMPDTAKSQGIDPDSLFELHPCVQLGAAYLRNAIKNFKGDLTKALSVYNFGGNAVLAGAYDTGYANTVLSRMDALQQWLTDNGYSNEFYTVLECTK